MNSVVKTNKLLRALDSLALSFSDLLCLCCVNNECVEIFACERLFFSFVRVILYLYSVNNKCRHVYTVFSFPESDPLPGT